jgi:hypothetical protein
LLLRWRRGEEGASLYPLKVFVGSLLALLFVLNPFNLIRFFSLSFLSPMHGEFALTGSDFIANVVVNAPLMANAFLGGHPFYGDRSTEIMISIPHHLTNWPGLLLAVAGIAIAVWKRNGLVGVLWMAIFLPPVLSQVWPTIWSSLSSFRLAFSLIPVYLSIALAVDYLTGLRGVRWAAYAGCLGLVVYQTTVYFGDLETTIADIASTPCGFAEQADGQRQFTCTYLGRRYRAEKEQGQAQFAERGNYYAPYPTGYRRFEQSILPQRRYAQLLAEKIRVAEQQAPDQPILVYAPTTDFVRPFGHLYAFNHLPFNLALYLYEAGVSVNYMVLYPRKLTWTESVANAIFTRLAVSQVRNMRLSMHLNYPYTFAEGTFDTEELGLWERVAGKLMLLAPKEIVRSVIPAPVPYADVRQAGGASQVYLATTDWERRLWSQQLTVYAEVVL